MTIQSNKIKSLLFKCKMIYGNDIYIYINKTQYKYNINNNKYSIYKISITKINR